MPYALVAVDGRLFAGLADGQLWESGDQGDTWRACALSGDRAAQAERARLRVSRFERVEIGACGLNRQIIRQVKKMPIARDHDRALLSGKLEQVVVARIC